MVEEKTYHEIPTSQFRGFSLADATFEKSNSNCSACVDDSCGTRDCMLQVYSFGEDRVVSGGICPKGNTAKVTKKAPNYVNTYNSMLNSRLESFTVPLSEDGDLEKILIPRSLTFLNEKGIFYSALYNHLGFEVSISPESNDDISNLGRVHSHSESCYPVILAHGHAAYLKGYMREGLDKLLLVNVIGAFDGETKTTFCPYVGSAGDVIKGNISLSNDEVLTPILRFNDPHHSLDEAIHKELQRVYGKRFPLIEVKDAVKFALGEQEKFLDEIHEKGEAILQRLKERNQPVFIGVGRGYTVLDDKASSKVHDLFASQGLHFIPSFFLRQPVDKNVDEFVDNMYWLQGRNMIMYNLRVAQDQNLYPVRETNFNCGADSIILVHEERIMKQADKPHLVLETDGHNSNAQFGTRILANNEVVNKHHASKYQSPPINKISNSPFTNPKDRIIGIPYMGDVTQVLASSMRAAGLQAEVMPTRTERSKALAKKYVTTNSCRPLAFQIGDHLAWIESLNERGIDPNEKAALFLPKAKGPCRFGQYSVVLRQFLDDEGYSEVPMFDPSTSSDYLDVDLDKKDIKTITALSFKGAFAHDLLESALLRTRPYELTEGQTDSQYNKSHIELTDMIETNPSLKVLKNFMKEQYKSFVSIPISQERHPLVLMNGEIFVRCHPQANQDSIKALEEHDLEVMLSPVSSWIRYINRMSLGDAWQINDFSKLWKSSIKGAYMEYVSHDLQKTFGSFLERREFHHPFDFVAAMEKDMIYHHDVGGESVVTVAETYAFMDGRLDVDGIYHVGPLGCMQETVATSRIMSLLQTNKKSKNSDDKKITLVPFIDAVFGETQLPNLDSQIALFAQNCHLRKEIREKG
ncbi:hypothetical protein COU57_03405 [Candidatus Pacearchaeota archaeon CG10_big_fil_rev_8_21_14_0_10_32_14]|nr:MAG: hypothetical protein COU57_03405 [Candidatus Pacearchaeota archaeon CG10_big_fil_rev_8_21_14_0_10_32_14]